MPIAIQDNKQLDTILSSDTYVLADFWATWCPPCRAIAPYFEQLSKANSADGKFSFVKVDVDATPDIAQKYGITAMPTFVLFKNGQPQPQDVIKGANPQRITALVNKVSEDVKKAVEEEAKAQEDQPTVSGSYTVSSNPSWKMAL
jgi:thioredoxin 1